MKKSMLAMVTAVLLLAVTQVCAAPRYGGGGYYGGRPGWGGGHWGPRVGIYYGGLGYYGYGYGYGYGYDYGYPYAYAPIVINAEPTPQVLIQQGAAAGVTAQNAPAANYWYYCTQPAGYFPYVQNCSQPWMKVVPQIPTDQPVTPRTVP